MERVLWWFLILRLVRAQTLCVPMSGCSVTLDNGANLDFCNIFDSGDLTWFEPLSGSTFLYNGKTAMLCETAGIAVCIAFPEGSKFNVGELSVSNMQCNLVSSDPSDNSYTMDVIYKDTAKNRQASIRVTYQGGSDVVQSFYYMADTTYNFILKLAGSSQPAGSNAADVAGIPGIILILLFLLAVATYVVVGVLVKKYWKDAEGVEMIPNYHFWKDFPFLVKDGIVFSVTAWPCCKYKQFGFQKI